MRHTVSTLQLMTYERWFPMFSLEKLEFMCLKACETLPRLSGIELVCQDLLTVLLE